MFKRPHCPALVLMLGAIALPAHSADLESYTKAAAETAQGFVQQLGNTMKTELKQNGPVAAIKVCSEQAPQIAGELSRNTGWKITRVSSRVRNPMLGMADSWEQEVLNRFQQQMDNGTAAAGLSHAEIVTEPDGQYFRFMKAIPVAEGCLTCHGDKATMPAPVQVILEQNYPHDQATGYKAGDLRGAVSIKQKI